MPLLWTTLSQVIVVVPVWLQVNEVILTSALALTMTVRVSEAELLVVSGSTT